MARSSYFSSIRRRAPSSTKSSIPITPSEYSAESSSYAPSETSLEEKEKDASGDLSETFEDPFPDFLWMTTEEPHRSRRMAILKAHPEVRKLMGPTLLTPPLVLLVLSIQLSLAYYFRNTHPFSWSFIATAYAVGGTANQNIFLAIHEITHNLAFKGIRANKVLAIFANLSIGVPYAMAFKGYHIEHHKFLGEDGIDTDLPSRIEAVILNNVAGKTFFATFQLLFYALRPGFIRTQKPTIWHGINLLTILAFDTLLVKTCGWNALVYLIMSSFFAGSLHPCAAHFIAEHYLMEGPKEIIEGSDGEVVGLAQETTSYYGKLNWLCYNVGYHNEHHDFPSVPWTRLPQLRRIAWDFYEPLPAHASWPYVTWKFITDPGVGMWSRAKRTERGEKIDPSVWHPSKQTKDIETERVEEISRGMDEAIERGYGSDRD